MAIKPYTYEDAQALIWRAEMNSHRRWAQWQALEYMYRTGMTRGGTLKYDDIPGRIWGDLPNGFELESFNYVLPYLALIIESVSAKDPDMQVTPFSGGEDAELSARVAQQVLRYYWKLNKVTHRVARDATQDAVVLGSGFAKTGWSHDEVEEDRDAPDIEAELAKMLETDRKDAYLSEREPMSVDDLYDMIPTTRGRVIQDEPYAEYVSAYDILVPSDARRMEETPWVAQRIVLPMDEVKARREIYNRNAISELQTLNNDDSYKHRGDEEGTYQAHADGYSTSDSLDLVEIYEFYDMRTRKLMVMQASGQRPLFHEDLPYSHRHAPFSHVRCFNDGGSRFWPFGMVENVASIQSQINEWFTEQIDNARRAGNKYFYDKDALDEKAIEELESDLPEVAIGVDTRKGPMKDLIMAIPREGLPADIYQARDDMRQALQEILGVNDFMAGGSGADRMSATAAAVVDGTATLRASGLREQVEMLCADIGKKFVLLCQEFMDEERAVRLVGTNGVAWLDVSMDDLVGEFDVDVRTGSTTSVNPSTREQRAMEKMELVTFLAEMGYDPAPIIRHIFTEIGMDPDVFLQQAPAPPQDPSMTGGPAGSPVEGGLGGAPIQGAGGPPAADQAQQGGGLV